MSKSQRSAAFKEQMADAMSELRSIMLSDESPTGNDRLTIRTIEVAEPSNYDARKVRKVREILNVSQTVFARLVGVSDVLVRSWERGVRQPAPIARRLLDQIYAHPIQFARLVRSSSVTTESRVRKVNSRGNTAKRNGKQAA
ncbi:MAG: helix-turn-helix domain-containing protein [Tepidisphaeraceae bacterium]